VIANALLTRIDHRDGTDDAGRPRFRPETVRERVHLHLKSRRLLSEGQDEAVADGTLIVSARMNVAVGDRVTLRPTHGSHGGPQTYEVADFEWTWGDPSKVLIVKEISA
jgi:hypothetical protein